MNILNVPTVCEVPECSKFIVIHACKFLMNFIHFELITYL